MHEYTRVLVFLLKWPVGVYKKKPQTQNIEDTHLYKTISLILNQISSRTRCIIWCICSCPRYPVNRLPPQLVRSESFSFVWRLWCPTHRPSCLLQIFNHPHRPFRYAGKMRTVWLLLTGSGGFSQCCVNSIASFSQRDYNVATRRACGPGNPWCLAITDRSHNIPLTLLHSTLYRSEIIIIIIIIIIAMTASEIRRLGRVALL